MSVNVAEVFGQDVFNEAVMKERLPEVTYKQMVKLMNEGGEVTLELADIVAKAMKEWAIEKGATHYTHIFQPYIVSIGARNTTPSQIFRRVARSRTAFPVKT